MYEGNIVGFCGPDTPETELGLMMTGAGATEAHEQAGSAIDRGDHHTAVPLFSHED